MLWCAGPQQVPGGLAKPLAREESAEGTQPPNEHHRLPSAWCPGERGRIPTGASVATQGHFPPSN